MCFSSLNQPSAMAERLEMVRLFDKNFERVAVNVRRRKMLT